MQEGRIKSSKEERRLDVCSCLEGKEGNSEVESNGTCILAPYPSLLHLLAQRTLEGALGTVSFMHQ